MLPLASEIVVDAVDGVKAAAAVQANRGRYRYVNIDISSGKGDWGLIGLRRQIADMRAKVAALATGQDVELHDVMMALEAESMTMSLATNVRNKAVEAYQEVFRMQF